MLLMLQHQIISGLPSRYLAKAHQEALAESVVAMRAIRGDRLDRLRVPQGFPGASERQSGGVRPRPTHSVRPTDGSALCPH
jgi:hypothetical protein